MPGYTSGFFCQYAGIRKRMAKSQKIVLHSVHTAFSYDVSIKIYAAQASFFIIADPRVFDVLKKAFRIGVIPAYLSIDCLPPFGVIIFIAQRRYSRQLLRLCSGKSLAGCLPLAYLFCNRFFCKSTRYFPTCSHNFPKAGEARFQGRSRLFRLLGKFPYLGESRRILMAVSSKTSSKTRFYYAATRRISSAAVQPSIWA